MKLTPIYKQFPLAKNGAVFAGFAYPRRQWSLPSGPLADRLAAAKKGRICGPYYFTEPAPNSPRVSFYLDDKATAPGLPWRWADQLPWEWSDNSRMPVRSAGWFIDDCQGETIRGVVFKLPKGRGYLAGWSMGEGMISELDKTAVYDSGDDAAHAADDLARDAAEVEREYQWVESMRYDLEEKLAEVKELWAEAKTLSRGLKQTGRDTDAAVICGARSRLRNIRTQIDQLLEDCHGLRDRIRDAA